MIDSLAELADKAVNSDLSPLMPYAKAIAIGYIVGQVLAVAIVGFIIWHTWKEWRKLDL